MDNKTAEGIVRMIVNLIAEKRYEEITAFAESEDLMAKDIKELVEDYLELNDLSHIDRFDTECKFHPKYEYHQLNVYHYKNGSGFHIDYDLTTDGELNDLTLQMEFLYEESGGLKAKFLDLHVM